METLYVILWMIFLIVVTTFGYLIFAGYLRKHGPETFLNGFMDIDKLKEICPYLFKKKDKNDPNDQKH